MGERSHPWNPWRALCDRTHIQFALDPIARLMGGAIYARRGDLAAIVIDPARTQVERRALLAHELVHDERGGVIDCIDHTRLDVCAIREERRVDAIVADRLIPRPALEAYIARTLNLGDMVTVDSTAAEFEVPVDVARVALRRLRAAHHPDLGMPPESATA